MMKCDCAERIGVNIDSWKQFQELKTFFEEQVSKGNFVEVPVEKPYHVGRCPNGVSVEWYADKWYKCHCCGILWEFMYPDFPAQGKIRKLIMNEESERNSPDGY